LLFLVFVFPPVGFFLLLSLSAGCLLALCLSLLPPLHSSLIVRIASHHDQQWRWSSSEHESFIR
jgi:hypothetical protein